MNQPTTLLVERNAPVLTLTLQRPEKRNALDRGLVTLLRQALERAATDPGVRAVILTGAGASFCSGADLGSFVSAGADLVAQFDERMGEFHALIRAVVAVPKPVIAAVDGGAVGFGCDLALACDLRVVSTRGYFQEKFVNIGLMADGGGTFFLPRLIGSCRALEYLMTGDPIDATTAQSWGMVNRVVSPESLPEEAKRLAERLSAGPPLALAGIKRALLGGLGGTVNASLELEREGQKACIESEDAREGLRAFFEKRPPLFRGT